MSKRHDIAGVTRVIEPDPTDVATAAALEAARQRFRGFRDQAGADHSRSLAGTYIVPKGFERWTFIRCGLRPQGDPRMRYQEAAAIALYEEMKARGWVDAAPGTFFLTARGRESTEQAFLMMMPTEVADEHKAWKTQAKFDELQQRRGTTVDDLTQQLRQELPGVVDFTKSTIAHQVRVEE
jgi:hypothetical protein